jgi:hypothetical protein
MQPMHRITGVTVFDYGAAEAEMLPQLYGCLLCQRGKFVDNWIIESPRKDLLPTKYQTV